jgi:ribonuclease HI
MSITIYTDGSCRGNPGPGGWATLIKKSNGGEEKVLHGSNEKTTNNVMELTAIIEALREIQLSTDTTLPIKIYSDSTYCVKGISEWLPGWIKTNFKGKKNVDLWKDYISCSKGLNITVEWVKAHNGHEENEFVDRLAFEEASRYFT